MRLLCAYRFFMSTIKKNPKWIEQAKAASRETLEDTAKAILRDTERLVPVDEGDLLRSLGYEMLSDDEAVVYATEEHALHVELGTRNMKAQPYLRPAARRKRTP